ncbi:MAG: class I SAM-dependent methyltransferase [Myxococcales bacterium]|nr:class I SAM-dependent methyltransferase [Myxococcales bacterium]
MDTSNLKILTLEENPERHERIIVSQQGDGTPAVRELLRSTYLEADRAGAFERFGDGLEFRTICRLLGTFAVSRNATLCELGGGAGFLAWALCRAGFENVDLVEPNGHFNTGTGYLRSRADSASLRIHNDLKVWHAGPGAYDVVLTKNCIHHFMNIAQAAASIRQKLKPGARWFAFREWFAESPRELYTQLASHPYCQPHGLYEWPYPAWHYVEAIEIAGFSLTAVVPSGYANNALGLYQEDEGGPDMRQLTAQIDSLLAKKPQATAQAFWEEIRRNRFEGGTARLFSRPQLMVFDVKPI